jgi:hypothetical protein
MVIPARGSRRAFPLPEKYIRGTGGKDPKKTLPRIGIMGFPRKDAGEFHFV